jgi:hypothetical protein
VPVYERFVGELGIRPRNILMITSNHRIGELIMNYAKIHDEDILRCEIYDIFEYQAKSIVATDNNETGFDWDTLDTNNPDKITKHYVNLNRRWRPHRPLFVSLLKTFNLLDHGLVSLGKSDCNKDNWERFQDYVDWFGEDSVVGKMLSNNKQAVISMPEMYLDTNDLVTNRAYPQPADRQFYETTMISLVSETTYFNDTSCVYQMEPAVFLSEKTWKAIMFKHPFMIISNHNTLSVLKGKGFETFGDFIDESYDQEKDDVLRMQKLILEVDRICKWDHKQIKAFCEYAKPICKRNFELLCSEPLHPRRVLL